VIDRDVCIAAFTEAVAKCSPMRLVRESLERHPVRRPVIGLAVGKAAIAMAHGAGLIERGLCITNVITGEALHPRWQVMTASHPFPDESSVAAGRAALALVESASEDDTILALISGGASSLLELPAPGITLDELRRRTSELMASGAPIHELNALRTSLSALKGGKLASRSLAPIVTLVISDVVGDDPRVIGSGPTVLDDERVDVIAPMSLFGEAIHAALAVRGVHATRQPTPLSGDVLQVAADLASTQGPLVAWGEPTVRLPAQPGQGGRATQLALALAEHLRGSTRSAFVAASDGRDATTDAAGAYVDGTTWGRIAEKGISPDEALANCDAYSALAAVNALFAPGPTGINHADVVVLG